MDVSQSKLVPSPYPAILPLINLLKGGRCICSPALTCADLLTLKLLPPPLGFAVLVFALAILQKDARKCGTLAVWVILQIQLPVSLEMFRQCASA